MDRAFYRRVFLNSNEHGGTAFIEAEVGRVHHHVDKYENKSASVNADLRIADCSRVVNIEFAVYGSDDLEHIRRKARCYRSTIDGFIFAVLAACDEIEAAQ